MSSNMLKKMLEDGATSLGIRLTEGMIASFLLYLSELKAWNKKINLTAITDDEDIIKKHFLDSLTVYPYINHVAGNTLLDIGAGAGFPGIPLKIIDPSLDVLLMDSVQKKVHFIRHIIRTLALEGKDPAKKGIDAIAARVEDRSIIERYRGRFDTVTSRAFSSLGDFVASALPYCRTGGMIVAIKGPAAQKELEEAQGVISGLSAPEILEVRVPMTDRTNTIIKFRKN